MIRDKNVWDIAAVEDMTNQIARSFSSNVNVLEGMNGNSIRRDGIVPATPTTVGATRYAAKAEYAAATMEHESAQLRLKRAQLQLD